ncbi:hypothetical protein BAE44_0024152, partial [Dichanthelium oligosanthes]
CDIFPGTSCGDPRFTGGDGNTFYFHGKKNHNFCILSDADLHINAHFIGNHNPDLKRDFTWVQALGVSFGDHRLYIGARRAIEWDEDEDHIQVTFDAEPVDIDTVKNARWASSKALPGLSVTRMDAVNTVLVELDGVFSISANAVPITDRDNRIHEYGKKQGDSLVHLDLGFQFHNLTKDVDGVLGQTYRHDYVSKVDISAKMPIMGGAPKYLSSGLFSADCAVSRSMMARGAGMAQQLCLAVAVAVAMGLALSCGVASAAVPPPADQQPSRGRPLTSRKSKFETLTIRKAFGHRRDYQVSCKDDKDNPGGCYVGCPQRCPNQCLVFCSYCLSFCECDIFPGTSCGDPRFTGGDGNTFYFHGNKDRNFCIVSDADLHINAHFIGNHNPDLKRDFTWVQALGVIFGDHRLYVGARKAVEWDEDEDHIQITFDGEPVDVDATKNARWESEALPGLSVRRMKDVNTVTLELDGVFSISANAVPVTQEDDRIHKYGKTGSDSLVHLDLGFQFHNLSKDVDGVLGQTYRPNYVTKLDIKAKMPIMGGAPKYLSSGLFSTDCAVSMFHHRSGGRGGAGDPVTQRLMLATPQSTSTQLKCTNTKTNKTTCTANCNKRCPHKCLIQCPSCKTFCLCDFYPGVSCGDPRFTGADGNNFYFHGKKDKDFCIVSDADLHINAHFIGKRNPAMSRDFTWIQALGIRFAHHHLYVGAVKTVKWDAAADHLSISFDDEDVALPNFIGSRWAPPTALGLSVTRTARVNTVVVELRGVFRIMANVVPITAEDSRIHNYGVTDDDSLAHLDLGFKFYDLTDDVHGVLGQTYRPDYVNKLNVTSNMPVMGGAPDYLSSDLFSTDCAVARFGRRQAATIVGGPAIAMVTDDDME